jgi:DNA adenine methylase
MMFTTLEITTKVKPFLKWAGGKNQLLNKLINYFPFELMNGQINKYAEPFIGGGALFFFIAQNFPSIKEFYISDINEELILIYRTIQKDVNKLIGYLENLEKQYYELNEGNQKDFFYQLRSKLNEDHKSFDFSYFTDLWIERAAILILLNRTCFNGLFRVNSKGEFNVPFGDYRNPKICDPENLLAVSNLLQETKIECADFLKSRDFIDASTFVYFDPPYRPITKTSSFTSYSKFQFGDNEQIRLANYFRELNQKDAKLLLSNSDPKNENPEDHFFENIFDGFRIARIDAKRMINCDASKRGSIKEIIIMNY